MTCSAPEAILIAEHLKALEPSAADAIRTRLNAREEQIRDRPKEDQYVLQVPCAFLDGDGACAIYEVRPITCRAYNSLDRTRCESAFNDHDPNAPLDIHAAAKIQNAIGVGLAAGIRDAGLDERAFRLMSIVRAILDDDALTERWAAARRLPDHLVEVSVPELGDYGTVEENEAFVTRLEASPRG